MASPKLVAALALGGLALPAAAGADPRLAAPGCITVTVQPGDNVWTLGQRAGITLDVIADLNPHIANLNLVHPGDQIAVNCPGLDHVKADPTLPAPIIVQQVNEMQPAEPWAGMAPWPGVNVWLPGDGTDTVASQTAILRALFDEGARGDQLIGLAAITEGESNRRLNAVGDVGMQDATWGPSVSPFQIRTLKAQRGTGGLRDIDQASTLHGGARAAIAIYDAAAQRGGDPLNPWTCHRLGNDRSFVDPYRELAGRMGMGA